MKWLIALFVIVIAVNFIVNLIKEIGRRIAENKKYRCILRESMHKVLELDLERYKLWLGKLEQEYESYRNEKVLLKDKNGKAINICPKCGAYMKIVKWRGDPFLGCSRYPDCRSYRKYDKISQLEI
jgi:hypothetical protein